MAVTTFTDLPNAAVQTGGRPRGSTITALRDNPIAIAEGDLTAPVNQAAWHPFNRTTGGVQPGVFYAFSTDGAVANVQTPVLEDGYEYRILFRELGGTSAGTDPRIELRRQSTGTYQGVGTLVSANATDIVSGEIYLSTVRRSIRMHPISGYLRVTAAGFGAAIQPMTAVNLMQEIASGDQIDRVRISLAAGNTDSGILILERRRLYV
jgi:hypothetical protein